MSLLNFGPAAPRIPAPGALVGKPKRPLDQIPAELSAAQPPPLDAALQERIRNAARGTLDYWLQGPLFGSPLPPYALHELQAGREPSPAVLGGLAALQVGQSLAGVAGSGPTLLQAVGPAHEAARRAALARAPEALVLEPKPEAPSRGRLLMEQLLSDKPELLPPREEKQGVQIFPPPRQLPRTIQPTPTEGVEEPVVGPQPQKLAGEFGMNPQLAQKSEAWMGRIRRDPGRWVRMYLNKYPNTISTDLARELFEGYGQGTPEQRSMFTNATQKPAGAVAKMAMDEVLAHPLPSGRKPIFIVLGGGPAQGKSTYTESPEGKRLSKEAWLTWDSTFSSGDAYKRAERMLELANVRVVMPLRSPHAAFSSAMARAEIDGRMMSIPDFIEMTREALVNTSRFIADHPREFNSGRLQVTAYPSEPGGGRKVKVEGEMALDYINNQILAMQRPELANELRRIADQQIQERKISFRTWRTVSGGGRGEPPGRLEYGSRRQLESGPRPGGPDESVAVRPTQPGLRSRGVRAVGGWPTGVAGLTVETAPGTLSGVLPGYHKATPELQGLFHRDVMQVLSPGETSRLTEIFGLEGGETLDVPGTYQGKTTPGSVILVRGDYRNPDVRNRMEGALAAFGMLTGQDAVAWSVFRRHTEGEYYNSLFASLGRRLTTEETSNFDKRLKERLGDSYFLVGDPEGVHVVVSKGHGSSVFEEAVLDAVFEEVPQAERVFRRVRDGNYITSGEYQATVDRAADAGGRGEAVRKDLSALGRGVEAVRERYAREHGWGEPDASRTRDELTAERPTDFEGWARNFSGKPEEWEQWREIWRHDPESARLLRLSELRATIGRERAALRFASTQAPHREAIAAAEAELQALGAQRPDYRESQEKARAALAKPTRSELETSSLAEFPALEAEQEEAAGWMPDPVGAAEKQVAALMTQRARQESIDWEHGNPGQSSVKMMNNSPTIPGTPWLVMPMTNPHGRYGDLARWAAQRPESGAIAEAGAKAFERIARRLRSAYPELATTDFVGLSAGPGHFAVTLREENNGDLPWQIKGGAGPAKHVIALQVYSLVRRLLQSGEPRLTGTDRAESISRSLASALAHEIVHPKVTGHSEEFLMEYARALALADKAFPEAVEIFKKAVGPNLDALVKSAMEYDRLQSQAYGIKHSMSPRWSERGTEPAVPLRRPSALKGAMKAPVKGVKGVYVVGGWGTNKQLAERPYIKKIGSILSGATEEAVQLLKRELPHFAPVRFVGFEVGRPEMATGYRENEATVHPFVAFDNTVQDMTRAMTAFKPHRYTPARSVALQIAHLWSLQLARSGSINVQPDFMQWMMTGEREPQQVPATSTMTYNEGLLNPIERFVAGQIESVLESNRGEAMKQMHSDWEYWKAGLGR